MKTYSQTKAEALQSRRWHLVDAAEVPLGRLATEVATMIRGKHKPQFTPHVDGGDFVVVVNAEKVHLTGRKKEQKVYYRHSGYVGGLKDIPFSERVETYPTRIILSAVKGMLPHGALGHQMIKKLKIYAGAEHPHSAQQPEPYTFKYTKAVTR